MSITHPIFAEEIKDLSGGPTAGKSGVEEREPVAIEWRRWYADDPQSQTDINDEQVRKYIYDSNPEDVGPRSIVEIIIAETEEPEPEPIDQSLGIIEPTSNALFTVYDDDSFSPIGTESQINKFVNSIKNVHTTKDYFWEYDEQKGLWKLKKFLLDGGYTWEDTRTDFYVGWHKIDDQDTHEDWRYFDKLTGYMCVGPIKLRREDGSYDVYMFDKVTGIIKTGWQIIDGLPFYFNPNKNSEDYGKAFKGWHRIDDMVYYFDSVSMDATYRLNLNDAHRNKIAYEWDGSY